MTDKSDKTNENEKPDNINIPDDIEIPEKINLPSNIPGGIPYPQDNGSPIRVYGPAEPVVVVYGPASMPDTIKKTQKGFFGTLKDKLMPPPPVTVYGPAEWFENKTTTTEPAAVYGPAEWFEAHRITTEEPLDVYGPAEWFETTTGTEPIDAPLDEPIEECEIEDNLPDVPEDMVMLVYGPAEPAQATAIEPPTQNNDTPEK